MLTPTVPTATEQVTATLLTVWADHRGAGLVRRLSQAGQLEVVPVLVKVFDAEAGARRQRRVARLR